MNTILFLPSARQPTASRTIVNFLLLFAGLLVQAMYPAPGLIGKLLAAALTFITFKAIAYWLIEILWPVMTTYLQKEFRHDFGKLKPLQKMLFVTGFYLLLLYALIATLGAIG